MRSALLASFFLCCFFFASAQKKDTTFSRLYIGASGYVPVRSTSFNDYWKQSPFAGIRIGANFLHGNVILDVSGTSMRTAVTNVPDLNLLLMTAGYELAIPLSRRLQFLTAATVGVTSSIITLDGNLYSTHEVVTMVNPAIQWRFAKRLSLGAGATWTRIYTDKRIDLLTAGLQLRYHFYPSPQIRRWLD